ncbi:MAG: hypothetical protein AAF664_09530, partial [Planctomycetota bacterium]
KETVRLHNFLRPPSGILAERFDASSVPSRRGPFHCGQSSPSTGPDEEIEKKIANAAMHPTEKQLA